MYQYAMPMPQWTGDQLDKVGGAEEAQIASIGRDGTLRKQVTIWIVRHGDDLYVRSVGGRDGHWFRGTQERHEGRIRAGAFSKTSHSSTPTTTSTMKSTMRTQTNTA